ncbi:MAG: phosphate ABC transporter substrate-binding protein, PhoT family [Bacteroidales bacterium]|nr:MAG: phosphate ABC transporter substrate-binding protein, PhoT family [Bacteroidales bacterium]
MRKLSTKMLLGIGCAAIFAAIAIFVSCRSESKQALDETPTRGDIKISVDESYQPIIDSEIFVFSRYYQYANITPRYKPEVDIINDFMNDSVKLIITNKQLTEEQIKTLRDTLIIARTTAFAFDAIALIVNKENRDTILTYQQVKDIFLGNIKTWKDIKPNSKLDKISVVFDNTKSGNVRYFKEKFEIATQLPENFYAVNTNEEVINFISKNRNALGIISVNWISDKDDPQSRKFTNGIRVMAISPFYDNTSFYLPEQGAIYNKSYPFTREVYLISRETFAGLGSGFVQWVTHDQGQRIILKSGLVPSVSPIRLIQVKH